jgi:hypothetical protein
LPPGLLPFINKSLKKEISKIISAAFPSLRVSETVIFTDQMMRFHAARRRPVYFD